jgi:hypothetical protein
MQLHRFQQVMYSCPFVIGIFDSKDFVLVEIFFSISILFSQHSDESRFLRKNWLSYWEHEVGRSENAIFSFKQIHLQSFIGNEN